jgi:hypothetical protein
MSVVQDLRIKIRDFLQRPRRLDPLLRDKPNWNMLASAFDTVADTEMAIQTYETLDASPDLGVRYLHIYGLLQALYVQQDAIESMVRALAPNAVPQYRIEQEPEANEVRKVRNKAIGHPTKDGDAWKSKDGKQMAYHIVQHSVCKGGFTLLTAFQDGDHTFTDHSIPELIDKNRTAVARVLQRIMDKLETAEREHRNMFKDEKLADIFAATLDYYFEKIYSGTDEPKGGDGAFAKIHVDLIARQIQTLREALEKRGLLNRSSNYEYELAEVEYPIAQLQHYFDGQGSLKDHRAADIFVFFVRDRIRKLERMAQELDAEYSDGEELH